MSKLKVAIGPLALACVLACSAAPTYGAFKAEKAGALVKVEGGKATFTFETYKAKCLKLTGEGPVDGTPGNTGASTKEDEPASGATTEAEMLGLKMAFKECKVEIGGKAVEAKANAEKCQIEIYQKEKAETALVSLRAAVKEIQCVITIETTGEPKCTVEIAASAGGENEYLESLKLKEVKGFSSEIEAESEVKELLLKGASAGCSIKEKEKPGTLELEAADKLTGLELVNPFITRVEGNPDFGEVTVGNDLTRQFKYKNLFSVLYEMNTIRNLEGEGGAFKFVENECNEDEFPAGDECKIKIKFKPKNNGEIYKSRLELPFEIKMDGRKLKAFEVLRGKGKP